MDDQDYSAKIVAIRAKVRGLTVEQHLQQPCPLCGKPADAPYRRYSPEGTVVEGCVDAHHTKASREFSEKSLIWHSRSVAKELRRQEWLRLQLLSPGV